MIKGIKVMLNPNNKQKTLLHKYAGVKRFTYNWVLEREESNYKNGGKFISDKELRKEFTKLKKVPEYYWLNEVSNNVSKQAIKDACIAYNRFFKGISKAPKYKSKKKSPPKFYQDNEKIQFTETHIKFEGFARSKKKNKQKLNWVRLAEKGRIPYGKEIKYVNPRVSFDGLNWWVSVGIEYKEKSNKPNKESIGIDLGITNLAICSDDVVYKNINKTKRVKDLEKRKKRLQRKVARKYENLKENKVNEKGEYPKKTKNIIKVEEEIKKLQNKLNGIRGNYLHQITTEIIRREPSHISLEDLNLKGMMKNKHLSKAIGEQSFYEFRRQIEYKSRWNNIEVRIVNRWYASSKICHECGYKNKELKLKERTWKCKGCGREIDRDKNASKNIRDSKEYEVIKYPNAIGE